MSLNVFLDESSLILKTSAQILFGFCAAYLLVTLAESFLHDHIHHARGRFRSLQRRYPRVLGAFGEAFRSHTVVHHALTYRDHVTQFSNGAQKRKVDSMLQDSAGQRIIRERYGVTLSLRSTFLFVAPILPVVTPMLWMLPRAASAGFLIPIIVYPLMSKLIHPYLHQPYVDAVARASWLIRLVLRTKYMRCVWRQHWMHHRYPRSNFNLILGGDWLRGTYRRPTPQDIQKMREVGLPVD